MRIRRTPTVNIFPALWYLFIIITTGLAIYWGCRLLGSEINRIDRMEQAEDMYNRSNIRLNCYHMASQDDDIVYDDCVRIVTGVGE